MYESSIIKLNDFLEYLKEKTVVVVDIRPYSEFVKNHIPGSLWIHFWDFLEYDENIPRLKSHEEIASILGKNGISDKDNVVIIYNNNLLQIATYTLWILEYMGQKYVGLLEAGFEEWERSNMPLERGISKPIPKTYAPNIRHDIRASLDEIINIVMNKADKPLLLDVRTLEEYTGSIQITPRPGHIPKAILLQLNTSSLTNLAFLSKVIDDLNKTGVINEIKKKGAITYCSTGERASLAWFILRKFLHLDNIKLYPESYMEYSSRKDLPIEIN